ncbi:MAG: peptide MFS transporter [Bryobacterales bacterium]|nr:peptide MFS transporter [Bryobacterales bacterium]
MGSHPPGLATLFFVEMWERFSYYGMRAILVLYCVAPLAQGGLGFDTQGAASLYGTYTMVVYLLSVPGGLVADRWLGARRAVLLGGVIIAAGQFCLVVRSMEAFYLGLSMIALGTGLLKPNISAMVGSLYGADDPRRDSGFSLFYMGINVGAVMAPLVCGYLAEGPGFKSWLGSMGFDPAGSWQWGFGAAGVGMVAGLVVFLLRRATLEGAGLRAEQKAQAAAGEPAAALTAGEWKRLAAISILFVFTICFWAAYEQKGRASTCSPSSWCGRNCLALSFRQLAAVAHAVLCDRAGAGVCADVDRVGRPAAIESGEVCVGPGGHWRCVLPAGAGVVVDGIGQDQPVVAGGCVFIGCGRRALRLSRVGLSTVTKVARRGWWD